jgi:hypothetical protein
VPLIVSILPFVTSCPAAGKFSLIGPSRRAILRIDMESAPPTKTRSEWTVGQKIAFRFFFIYLTIQILTDSFLWNLVGYTFDIWGPSAKIFTPPFLWLNRHLFHFRYIPASWTTFSDSLRTIRDIVYLFLAVLACAIWSVADKKRTNYNKLHYWFSQALIALEQDSVGHILTLRPTSKKDSLPLIFTYLATAETGWQLDGKIGRDHVRLKLQKIDPDTAFPLLRVRRRIFVADDEPE